MIAGVVGKPNVGKSTFYRSMTLAEAEVANFPFTTIKPNMGMGYVRSSCPCTKYSVECSPKNSVCRGGVRFTPVKLIDVAGLVPGAHEGKGLGNQFLDDLSVADVLIHVVDISGRTNEKGEPAKGHDPEVDIKFLEDEIDYWFSGIIERNWKKITSKVRHAGKDPIRELSEQLSGLKVSEHHTRNAIRATGLPEDLDWDDDEIRTFAITLRKSSKPILIAGNKIDLDDGNYERLKEWYSIQPVCAEAELALRQADANNLIQYVPGGSSFEYLGNLGEKQRKGLEYVRENILVKYGSTGVQDCLNSAVFDVLGYIVVYPVENESKMSDSKGNILPDSHLMPEGSTALDLAYRIHTSIGEKFIGAIDCASKKKIGKDHVLSDCDVVKILTSR